MFCDIWRTSLHQFLPGHSRVISRTHVVCYCSGTIKTFFQTMNMSTKQLNLLNIDKTANNAKTSKNALYTCRIRTAHTHPFNGPWSRTTRVSRYQKDKTSLDFTEARDSEWQWHQLDHMQVCTSLQTDSHASTPALSFLQAGCPSCRPTNSVKALKALQTPDR